MSWRETMAATLAAGATYRSPGEALGINPGAARMRARRAGLLCSHRWRPQDAKTAHRIQVARRMLAEGCDLEDVAARLGMQAPAVRAMLRRARA